MGCLEDGLSVDVDLKPRGAGRDADTVPPDGGPDWVVFSQWCVIVTLGLSEVAEDPALPPMVSQHSLDTLSTASPGLLTRHGGQSGEEPGVLQVHQDLSRLGRVRLGVEVVSLNPRTESHLLQVEQRGSQDLDFPIFWGQHETGVGGDEPHCSAHRGQEDHTDN